MQGAVGVWVGTRFVAAEESGASRLHKEAVVSADFTDTLRTLVVSGRPLRVRMNEWLAKWEAQPEKIKELTDKGIVPIAHDMENDVDVDPPFLMGQVSAIIKDIKPAKDIVEDMVREAVTQLKQGQAYLSDSPKARL